MQPSELSKEELLRYSRHLLLPEVGMEGQKRLKNARILVVGAGGLGSPTILYLAAAGIGTIGIVDFDCVDTSNLQRQIIYTNNDVGASKVERAAVNAKSLNPEIAVECHSFRLSKQNAIELISNYDVVVDGSDNFSTRYLVNDACVLLRKPNIYGSIYRFEGQASVFAYKDSPCYRCLFPEPPPADAIPNCAEGGVLGVTAGLIGCIQATEAIKIVLHLESSLAGKLLLYDALGMRFQTLPIPKNQDCPICGDNPKITKLENLDVSCETAMREQLAESCISPSQLKQELQSAQPPMLLDVRNNEEVALGRIQNAKHIPLALLPDALKNLDRDANIVAYCKSGIRSLKAVQLLKTNGFAKVRSLEGGIIAWSEQIDQSLRVY